MQKPSILIVDDDRIILDSLCEYLNIEGYTAVGVTGYAQAMTQLSRKTFSLVITDVNIPDSDGFEILKTIKNEYPQTVVIIITGYGTIESAVEAIKLGAYDYLTKPIIDDELILAVQRAIHQQSLMSENQQLKMQLQNKYSLDNIISQDHKMARIFELIGAVAQSNTTILMTGPSGTGKSKLARAIHYKSDRRDKPFIEVSCGAIPESLLESELFGHTKGAFTGAVRDKPGKFLAADTGTIFLDEISSATPALQVKLLRVLQEKEFEPVGSNKTVRIDTRVILASNRNLEHEVAIGNFREDLFYRINIVSIDLPPLNQRMGDVPILTKKFLKNFTTIHHRQEKSLSPEALQALQQYNWPGNIRELENVIERAVLLSKNNTMDLSDLPTKIIENSRPPSDGLVMGKPLKQALEEPEKKYILATLCHYGWNRQKTAKALGLNRTTLYKKMKKYNIENNPSQQ